jgi:hypothetical protein
MPARVSKHSGSMPRWYVRFRRFHGGMPRGAPSDTSHARVGKQRETPRRSVSCDINSPHRPLPPLTLSCLTPFPSVVPLPATRRRSTAGYVYHHRFPATSAALTSTVDSPLPPPPLHHLYFNLRWLGHLGKASKIPHWPLFTVDLPIYGL